MYIKTCNFPSSPKTKTSHCEHQTNVFWLLLKEVLNVETQKWLYFMHEDLMHAAYECNVKQSYDPLIFWLMTPVLTFTSILRWTKVYWLQCCCSLYSWTVCHILTYCTCLVHRDAFLVLSLLSTLDVSVSELQPPVEPTELKKDEQIISHYIELNVNGVESAGENIDNESGFAWGPDFKTVEPIKLSLTVSFSFAYS